MVTGIAIHDIGTDVDCRLVIAHPSGPQALVVRAGGYWELPALTPLEQHPAAVHHINLATYRLFGLRTYVRQLLSETVDASAGRILTRFYEVEVVNRLARQRIRRTAWVDQGLVGELEFRCAEDREAIEDWLSSSGEPGEPAGAPPWAQPGWFDRACDWMRGVAASAGTPVSRTPDQRWSDTSHCVLTADTPGGSVQMVASAAARGGPLTHIPGLEIGEVVERDEGRNWVLYRAPGGPDS